jgi:pimeloyl-ACP methyl ester carboxylesterase
MERHLRFQNQGQTLLGVLSTPDPGSPRRNAALVFLHGWAGYRIGPHQMFTKLARRGCALGFPSLTFDFRGRGDSEGEAAAASIATMVGDAQAAAAVLRETGVERLALIGVCSGGEVALGAGALIPQADAMVLWSVPQVAADRSHADRAKRLSIFRTYAAKLFRRETWAKLVSGGLNFTMIGRALRGGGKGAGEESAPEDREIDFRRRFLEFRGDILFLYGRNDPTTPDCVAHYEALSRQAGRRFVCHVIEGANHSFYSLAWEQEVFEQSLEWLDRRYPPLPSAAAATAGGALPTGAPA